MDFKGKFNYFIAFLSKIVRKIGFKLNSYSKENDQDIEDQAFKEIWQAYQEWQTAENNFNHISESDLIDYSIYNIETTRKKYVYLLKKAQEEKFFVGDLQKVCGNNGHQ